MKRNIIDSAPRPAYVSRRAFILVLILVAILLAGCQPTTSKTEYSTEQICKDLALLKTSYTQLQAMEDTASLKALEAQLSVVRTNLSNVVQSAANLTTVKLTTLEDSVEELSEAYTRLPEDTPLPEAMKSLAPELKAVGDAITKVGEEIGCTL